MCVYNIDRSSAVKFYYNTLKLFKLFLHCLTLLLKFPRWLLTAVCSAAILYITLAPHPVGQELLPVFPGYDKLIHGIMFGGLAFCAALDALLHKKSAPTPCAWLWVGAACIVFGGVDEVLQGLLTDARAASPADWLADIAGTCLVLGVMKRMLKTPVQ